MGGIKRIFSDIKKNKRLLYLLSCTFVLATILAVTRGEFHQVDFDNYCAGAEEIFAQRSPYGNVEFFTFPWTSILMLPFLILPDSIASWLWLFLNILSLLTVVNLSLGMIGIRYSSKTGILISGIALISPPGLLLLRAGQISSFVVLAILWLLYRFRQNQINPIEVFLLILVMSAKPHISFVMLIIFLAEMIRNKRIKDMTVLFCLGLIIVILFSIILPSWFIDMMNSIKVEEYRAPGNSGVEVWRMMNLKDLGVFYELLVLPTVIALYAWYKNGLTNETVAMVLTSGLILSPYSRMYDYFLLIPSCCIVLTRNRNLGIVSFTISLFSIPFQHISVLAPVVNMLIFQLSKLPIIKTRI